MFKVLYSCTLLLLVFSIHAKADTAMSACITLMQEMASTDVSDETGSISTAYDCEEGLTIVTSQIHPNINSKAVVQAKDSFIANYCLSISKNYLLADKTSKEWFKIVYRGGVQYIIRHRDIEPIVQYKSLDDCLKYVQIMENLLPENPYDQIKFIRTFNP